MSSSSYTALPDAPRTLLNYITSFGVTASDSNDGSSIWNTGRQTLTLTTINSPNDYFTRYNQVKLFQGDGSYDTLDWVIFNFDRDYNGDFDGYSTSLSYFGGENTCNGGTGGLSITYGVVWGWANNGWNKLFQMNLPGGGAFNHMFAGWWASGNTVSSSDGKYSAYDTLPITHIAFSVHADSSSITTPDTPSGIRVTATLTTTQSIVYRKFISGASISFDVISSNAGAVPRTHESSNTSILSIPTASAPSGSIVAPGKVTIKVTQPATGNYTEIIENSLITIVIVGSGVTYSSENMTSLDLSGTNLTSSVFSSCNLTSANLYGATINASTNFSTATLTSVRSGRIIGITSLLPNEFKLI